jgi:uncharacterized protein YigA (DUF484 family)
MTMTDTDTGTATGADARADDAPPDLRQQILGDPGLILDDTELMRALLRADRSAQGRNVVDLRGVLVDRLEERLDRLEDTHREVLAAAYDNVAGMNQVHRACLALLEPADLAGFLRVLSREVPPTLGVEMIRLGLEAPDAPAGSGLGPDGPYRAIAVALPAGGIDGYLTQGRGLGARRVTLRQGAAASPELYGQAAGAIRSEALLKLDLGRGRAAGLLAFGATDPERFDPEQGTDLLGFLAGVVERSLRRWLD